MLPQYNEKRLQAATATPTTNGRNLVQVREREIAMFSIMQQVTYSSTTLCGSVTYLYPLFITAGLNELFPDTRVLY